jgi:hypothetical protein
MFLGLSRTLDYSYFYCMPLACSVSLRHPLKSNGVAINEEILFVSLRVYPVCCYVLDLTCVENNRFPAFCY